MHTPTQRGDPTTSSHDGISGVIATGIGTERNGPLANVLQKAPFKRGILVVKAACAFCSISWMSFRSAVERG